jgi:hypothetical protein
VCRSLRDTTENKEEKDNYYTASVNYYNEALTILKKIYPKGHPDIIGCLTNLSGIHTLNNKFLEAQKCTDEMVNILDQLKHLETTSIAKAYNQDRC